MRTDFDNFATCSHYMQPLKAFQLSDHLIKLNHPQGYALPVPATAFTLQGLSAQRGTSRTVTTATAIANVRSEP